MVKRNSSSSGRGKQCFRAKDRRQRDSKRCSVTRLVHWAKGRILRFCELIECFVAILLLLFLVTIWGDNFPGDYEDY